MKNFTTAVTFITTIGGTYQVWEMGKLNSVDNAVNLIGIANDANSLSVFFK